LNTSWLAAVALVVLVEALVVAVAVLVGVFRILDLH
jgi:hypothetical protein